MNPAAIHQARSEYLSAAIAETNAVCNLIEADDDKAKLLKEVARQAGATAQEKFEEFLTAVNKAKASKGDEA
jgi:hypothetical protein